MESDIWDVVIIGTGLPESIVASGLSLRGYKVLVIDENFTYGGVWNTVKYKHFSDCMLEKWSEKNNFIFDSSCFYGKKFENNENEEDTSKIVIDLIPKVLFSRGKLVELIISCNITNYLDFQGIEDVYYCELKDKGNNKNDENIETLGDINNDLSEYLHSCEFMCLRTPFSKSDIFSSNDLSLVEKRQIMRLYNGLKEIIELRNVDEKKVDIDLINDPFRSPALISNSEILKKDKNESDKVEFELFSEFQDKWKISDKILSLIKHTISFIINKSKDEFDSINDFEKYLNLLLCSLNQHGCTGTPFIYPCYGICDLTQAFSRLAAVKGALQRLGTKIINMELLDNIWNLEIKGENTSSEIIKCRLIITPYRNSIINCFLNNINNKFNDLALVSENNNEIEKGVICAVAILDSPLSILGGNNKISTLTLNVSDFNIEECNYDNVVSILQCNSHTGCCSNKHYIVYLNMVIEKNINEYMERHRDYIYSLLDYLVNSKNHNTKILSKASYFYKQKLTDPKLLNNESILFLPDPCINNNSFLLLDEDIEKSLISLEYSLKFLSPGDNYISHKNFHLSPNLELAPNEVTYNNHGNTGVKES
ncbi:Rab GDP dissociation inhibitor [Cryptosporidium bovis]|uniref:Rab GDP dissociation inhibitor n=1 Tax=Cryptosporidium bovis TaxID=310047 RepID=UPI00351A208A|nr:Rab GDP dissociation inhibitor [Cryptosporidium bovis]